MFEYLDKDGTGVINLALVADTANESLSDLDDDVSVLRGYD